jgi:hypothetical protein
MWLDVSPTKRGISRAYARPVRLARCDSGVETMAWCSIAVRVGQVGSYKRHIMRVDGPTKREMDSVLAQLRHAYANLIGTPGMQGPPTTPEQARAFADRLLAPQIRRLESLARALFEP